MVMETIVSYMYTCKNGQVILIIINIPCNITISISNSYSCRIIINNISSNISDIYIYICNINMNS